MFQRILVPLDGSPRAEQAVPVAARIAHAAVDSCVVLVRVVPPLFQLGADAEQGSLVRPTGPKEIDPERLDTVAYLTRITGWPCLSGIPTSTEVRWGPPAPAILAAAEAHTCELIVLCSHGRTGPSRWVMGSVAQQVVRHAPMPVFVLRERGTRLSINSSASRTPLRVLVPLDGSPLAEEALRPAAQLALAVSRARAVTVELMMVVSPYEADEMYMPEALALLGAQAYLKRVAQLLEADVPGVRAVWHVHASLDIANSILQGADIAGQVVASGEAPDAPSENTGNALGAERDASARYDLLAMATHGRTGFTRWATGSITERVLHHSQLPLLVVRAHAAHAPVETGDLMPAQHAEYTEDRDAGAPALGS